MRFPNDTDVWFFALKGTIGDEATIINNLNTNVETNTKFPKGSSRITAGTTPNGDGSNGFFKIYRSGGTSATYNWQARTSDSNSHDIYIYFANAGTYPMEIAERSAGHAIDKFALYKVDDYNLNANDLDALVASNIATTGTSGASYNSPYTVNIEVSDDGSPALSESTEFLWYIDDSANEAPVAIATADDLDGLAPHVVNFVGQNSTDDDVIVSYVWNFGTGDTSNEPNPQYIFNTVGNYQVTLTVSDIQGLEDTSIVPIIVNTPSGSPTAVATADVTNGIAPLVVNFNGSGSFDDGQIDSYSWDFGDGSLISNLPNPEHTYNTAGDFTAVLIVTDNDGITNFDEIDITVLPISVTGVTLDPTTADLLVGENTTLTATVLPIDATDSSVVWSSSDDLVATVDANGLVTAVGIGTATITVTTNDGGFTATSTLNVTEAQISCQWTDLASSNLNKVESQSAKIGNKLYVLAGFLENLKITGVTEIYDVNLDEWSTGAPMLLPVTYMGVATVGDEIWIIGGFAGNHPGVATEKVQIYNTLTNTWRYGVDLPSPRASGASVKNGDNIHYFGGLLPDRLTDVGDHYVLDLNNEQAGWTTAAPLPDPRNHLSAANINGLIYAIGGQFGHDNVVVDQKFLDVYDPNTNIWSRLANLPSERSHFEPGTLVYDNKIIIVGGRRANFFFNDVTQYDPILNQWNELCELPNNILAPAAKAFGNRLIVANGGIDGTSNPTNATRWLPIQQIANQAPVASNIATPISGDAPLTVDFDGSLSSDDNDDIVSYSWDFGDGSFASGTTTTHVYINAGMYTAALTVTDGEGLIDTATVVIEVVALPVPVTGVTLEPTITTLVIGENTTLTATVLPLDATDSSVVWISSDDLIATVDSNGLVTAIAVGSATITVTTIDGGLTASSVITVNATPTSVTGVTLEPTITTLVIGENKTLTATVLPLDATDSSVVWSSSDDLIATVDSNGLVTAIAVGSATITVTTIDGGFTASSAITVNATPTSVTGVTLEPTITALAIGENTTLIATVLPLDAADSSVVWSSSDD